MEISILVFHCVLLYEALACHETVIQSPSPKAKVVWEGFAEKSNSKTEPGHNDEFTRQWEERNYRK